MIRFVACLSFVIVAVAYGKRHPLGQVYDAMYEENVAWVNNQVKWRNRMVKWMASIEEQCSITNPEMRWRIEFPCPDFSNVTCTNVSMRREELDLSNCTIVSCADGRYCGVYALDDIWMKNYEAHKYVMAAFEEVLEECWPSECPAYSKEPDTMGASDMPTPPYEQKARNSTTTEAIDETKAAATTTSETITEYTTVEAEETTEVLAAEDVRLADGTSSYGRVEIKFQGVWGTICDDDWDIDNARVVCRMLGFSDAVAAPGQARFGMGTGDILLDDVSCFGNEASIFACDHSGWRIHNCVHSEDASVICQTAGNPTVGMEATEEYTTETTDSTTTEALIAEPTAAATTSDSTTDDTTEEIGDETTTTADY